MNGSPDFIGPRDSAQAWLEKTVNAEPNLLASWLNQAMRRGSVDGFISGGLIVVISFKKETIAGSPVNRFTITLKGR
jgi:hypothetical protein